MVKATPSLSTTALWQDTYQVVGRFKKPTRFKASQEGRLSSHCTRNRSGRVALACVRKISHNRYKPQDIPSKFRLQTHFPHHKNTFTLIHLWFSHLLTIPRDIKNHSSTTSSRVTPSYKWNRVYCYKIASAMVIITLNYLALPTLITTGHIPLPTIQQVPFRSQDCRMFPLSSNGIQNLNHFLIQSSGDFHPYLNPPQPLTQSQYRGVQLGTCTHAGGGAL